MNSNWNRDYLKGYILLYSANADLNLSSEETDFINSKLDELDLEAIKAEFDHDSDYEALSKIQSGFERLDYSDEERKELLDEVLGLFNTDGEYDQVEKYILSGLKRILR
jgi:hypothetical protein